MIILAILTVQVTCSYSITEYGRRLLLIQMPRDICFAWLQKADQRYPSLQ